MDKVLMLFLSLFVLYDAVSIRALPGQREIYSVVLVLPLMIVLLESFKIRLPRKILAFIVIWIIAACLYVWPVPTQPIVYYKYVFGDLSSILLPVVILLFGIRFKDFFESGMTLKLFVFFLAIAAGAAFFFREPSGRFEPPSLFLIVFAWIFVLHPGKPIKRVVSAALLLGSFVLALGSGERTSIAVWVLTGPTILLFKRFSIARAASLGILVLALFGLMLYGIIKVDIAGQLEGTRFSTLASGEADASVLARVLEARDAVTMAVEKWKPLQFLVGFGHGATYRPYYSFIERNVTDEGFVHNIHVGPVLIFFRYGLMGVLLYLTLLVSVTRELLMIRSSWGKGGVEVQRILFTMGIAMYLLNLFIRNIIVDPVFSYLLAGFLYMRAYRCRGMRFVELGKGVFRPRGMGAMVRRSVPAGRIGNPVRTSAGTAER
jgi:hypothetical protein